MKRILVLFLTLLSLSAYSQSPKDKMSTKNYAINMIYTTQLGWIIDYNDYGSSKQIFLKSSFFRDGTAVRVAEDDTIAPQMNLVYKNLKPFKLKIYVPVNVESRSYIRTIDILSPEMVEKFQAKELTID